MRSGGPQQLEHDHGHPEREERLRAVGQPPASTAATPRTWFGLAVLVLAVFIICVDATVLDLAIPAISLALQPSATQLLWIIDIYPFVVAGLLITMGTLGDRIGRRRLLLIGAAGFGVASALAAWSTSAELLIAARALQGIAGATLMPSTLGLIRSMFPDRRQRTRAIGIWAAAAGAGTAAGPLVGGWLLEHFWWGSVFIVNLPIMLVLLVLGPLFIVESRDPNPGRFDLLSAVLSSTAIIAIVYAIKESAAHGIAPAPIVTGAAGLALGWWFLRRQRRADAMLDLSLFRIPRFSVGVVTNLLSALAFGGVIFFGSQYLQTVLGAGPLQAGLFLLPGVAVSILTSVLAGVLVQRIRLSTLMITALGLAAGGAFTLVLAGTASSALPFILGYLLIGAGVGVLTTLTSDLVVDAAPAERASTASSISETGYELGMALGVALLGSLVMGVYRRGIDTSMLDERSAEAARDTIGSAMEQAAGLDGVGGAQLAASASEAFVSGMHTASVLTAVILLANAVLVALLLRRERAAG